MKPFTLSFFLFFTFGAFAQNAEKKQPDSVPQRKELATVTVTGKRPLIEQKIDRTIVNVDAMLSNNGASALDVLENAPGVSVDREGNISLKGKDGW